MEFKCPGSFKVKEPKPEIIKCPTCFYEVEIWSDEIKARCPKCNSTVVREMEQSCLDWCRYAKECVGEDIYNRQLKNRLFTIKEKLIEKIEKYFGEDKKRIVHAMNVMSYAEQLLKEEKGDFHIVIPASILHDVGIKTSEEKYGSSAARFQEREGPEIARKILLEIGLRLEDIDEICEIIAYHHTPGKINTQNFKLLYDSDLLVNIKDEVNLNDKVKVREIIEKRFLTEAGKKIALKVYL